MIHEPILFPDAAALAIGYLDDKLAEPVHSDIPNPRLDTFVTIRRSGGVRETAVSDAAQLQVECWGASKSAAHDLAQVARAHLLSLGGRVVAGVQVYRVVEFGGPAELPDLSGQPRFVFTLSMSVRGTAL